MILMMNEYEDFLNFYQEHKTLLVGYEKYNEILEAQLIKYK